MHKYIRVTRGLDGVEVMSMVNLVMVKEAMLCYVQDVIAIKGMGKVLSDHHVVLCS